MKKVKKTTILLIVSIGALLVIGVALVLYEAASSPCHQYTDPASGGIDVACDTND